MSTEAALPEPAGGRIVVPTARLPLRLRLVAWLLVTFTVLLALGVGVHALARHTSSAPLPLAVGASTTVHAYRVLPGSARLSMALPRPGADAAVDHARIRVRVVQGAAAETQEALPTSSWSARQRWRDLAPPGRGADGHRLYSRLAIPAGRARLEVTVLAVDPALLGQTATVQIQPQLGFKSSDPRLAWLWWFYLWPVYALLIALSAGVLAWRIARWRRGAGAAVSSVAARLSTLR